MDIEFDPAKDAANIEKHGISLERAADLDMETAVIVADDRFAEPRFRAYGLIDGLAYCLAFTLREAVLRVISLRRAHKKEMDRYGG
jgi:uncharacterized DUF497 family protein